jgi:hypothetical protein
MDTLEKISDKTQDKSLKTELLIQTHNSEFESRKETGLSFQKNHKKLIKRKSKITDVAISL